MDTLLLAFSADDPPVPPERALFLGARPHPLLCGWPDITGWQPLKPLADDWERAGFPRVDEPSGRWPVVMLLPGKSRDETLAGFAMARDHLLPGGRIVCAMANTAGAARFEKEFAKATGHVTSIQKHKCRAFHAVEDGSWNEELIGEWRKLGIPRPIQDTSFITQAGVFSHGRIDPGSRLLAAHLPPGLHGRIADLGAGWGYLSHAALARCPGIECIDLYESDSRALACAKHNLAAAARQTVFHWHDVTTGLTETCDAILMNPPFHTGQETDVDLGRAFLTSAAAALRRHGKLHLVANRQLPYEAVLDSLGLGWRKLAEDATYKILFAEKR
jgi:16S rRNA (guanine1207-N2)-methyltransferase